MKLEEIKEGQYLYYTERGCVPFKGSSPDHVDSLFHVRKTTGVLKMHLVCGNIGGAYKNYSPDEDPLGGSINNAMFAPEMWFLTDFPGGDAAEWMSRNYPLDGQATVKDVPAEPIKYDVNLIQPAAWKKQHYLCRSLDGKLIMRQNENGSFVLLAHDQETLVEMSMGDARDFALWILQRD